jgi:hypothetical protein
VTALPLQLGAATAASGKQFLQSKYLSCVLLGASPFPHAILMQHAACALAVGQAERATTYSFCPFSATSLVGLVYNATHGTDPHRALLRLESHQVKA